MAAVYVDPTNPPAAALHDVRAKAVALAQECRHKDLRDHCSCTNAAVQSFWNGSCRAVRDGQLVVDGSAPRPRDSKQAILHRAERIWDALLRCDAPDIQTAVSETGATTLTATMDALATELLGKCADSADSPTECTNGNHLVAVRRLRDMLPFGTTLQPELLVVTKEQFVMWFLSDPRLTAVAGTSNGAADTAAAAVRSSSNVNIHRIKRRMTQLRSRGAADVSVDVSVENFRASAAGGISNPTMGVEATVMPVQRELGRERLVQAAVRNNVLTYVRSENLNVVVTIKTAVRDEVDDAVLKSFTDGLWAVRKKLLCDGYVTAVLVPADQQRGTQRHVRWTIFNFGDGSLSGMVADVLCDEFLEVDSNATLHTLHRLVSGVTVNFQSSGTSPRDYCARGSTASLFDLAQEWRLKVSAAAAPELNEDVLSSALHENELGGDIVVLAALLGLPTTVRSHLVLRDVEGMDEVAKVLARRTRLAIGRKVRSGDTKITSAIKKALDSNGPEERWRRAVQHIATPDTTRNTIATIPSTALKEMVLRLSDKHTRLVLDLFLQAGELFSEATDLEVAFDTAIVSAKFTGMTIFDLLPTTKEELTKLSGEDGDDDDDDDDDWEDSSAEEDEDEDEDSTDEKNNCSDVEDYRDAAELQYWKPVMRLGERVGRAIDPRSKRTMDVRSDVVRVVVASFGVSISGDPKERNTVTCAAQIVNAWHALSNVDTTASFLPPASRPPLPSSHGFYWHRFGSSALGTNLWEVAHKTTDVEVWEVGLEDPDLYVYLERCHGLVCAPNDDTKRTAEDVFEESSKMLSVIADKVSRVPCVCVVGSTDDNSLELREVATREVGDVSVQLVALPIGSGGTVPTASAKNLLEMIASKKKQ